MIFANTKKYELTRTLKFKLRREVGLNMLMSVYKLSNIIKLAGDFSED